MKKDPLLYRIFKGVLLLLVVFLLFMQYWSSLVVEKELISLKRSMRSLKKELQQVRHLSPTKEQLVKALSTQPTEHVTANLLTPDPFYQSTLPEILGADFVPSGELRTSSMGRPKNLHPFSNWADVNRFREKVTTNLAGSHVGIYETMAPRLATSMMVADNPETGKPEIIVKLREDVYWAPLKPEMFSHKMELAEQFQEPVQVTAHDVKFYYDVMMNPFVQESGAVALRTYFEDLYEVEVVDDFTLILRWRTKDIVSDRGIVEPKMRYGARLWSGSLTPLPRFVYQYFSNGDRIVTDESDPEIYRKSSLFAENFSNHWAKNVLPSCGAYLFEQFTDRSILFRRNGSFYDPQAALIEESTNHFKENPDSLWQDFKVEQTDLTALRPDQLIEWQEFLESPLYQEQMRAGSVAKRLDYLSRSFSYIGWNSERVFFKSPKVRRAMTLAIDRDRIIKDILNNMAVPITGPLFIGSENYDHTVPAWPFDPERAAALLEEEGWFDRDGDGIREKLINGKKVVFRFKLLYFVKATTTKAVVEYIATTLRSIGVDCQIQGVDLNDISQAMDDKNFDAITLAWGQGSPPDDPRQLWYSTGAKEKGSSNFVGFQDERVDAIINQLDFEYDPENRKALYHRFHQILHKAQPYTFLFTPKATLVYRDRVRNVFVPAENQDLIPGANVEAPVSNIFWIDQND